MTLRLTNTMKRTKETFVPVNPDHVAMYVCEPTVYNFAHIGNARRLPQRPGHFIHHRKSSRRRSFRNSRARNMSA